MKKVLLCGSTGFVGRAIAEELSVHGFEILPVSRNNGLDLTDAATFDRLSNIPEFDVAIFAAGKSGVMQSWAAPESYFRENILSILTVLNLLRTRQNPLVYISSYMYGNPEYLPIDEKHPTSCNNPYAYSKQQAEEICAAYFKLYKIPMVILRPFNLYGSGMATDNLIGHILSQLSGSSEILVKDLTPRRDYLHIRDLGRAVTAILRKGFKNFAIYNIGSGYSMSVEEIIGEIQQAAGTRMKISTSNEARKNEIPDCYADTSAIFRDYGWAAEIPFERGIEELLGESRT